MKKASTKHSAIALLSSTLIFAGLGPITMPALAVQPAAETKIAAGQIDGWIKDLQSPNLATVGAAYKRLSAIKTEDPSQVKVAAQKIVPLLNSKQAITRNITLDVFRQLGAADVGLEAIVPLLADTDGGVSLSAVMTIGGLGEKAQPVLPQVIKFLQSDRQEVRAAATMVFADMKDAGTPAIPELMTLLQDKRSDVRVAASYSLGSIGKSASKAAPQLIKAVKAPDEAEQAAAIYALSKMGSAGHEVIPDIVEILRQQKPKANGKTEALLLRRAINALGEFGPTGAPGISELLPLLKSPRYSSGVSYALGRMGEPVRQFIPQILTILSNAPDESSQGYILEMIGRVGTAEQIPDILPYLKSPQENTRVYAIGALGLIGKPSLPHLLKLTQGDNLEMRRLATGYLGYMGPDAIVHLKNLLKDKDEVVRENAKTALDEIMKQTK